MKILNKKELQQIAINHSLDIDFIKRFYKHLQNIYSRTISFLIKDLTLASEDPLRFRYEWIYNKIMTNDEKIIDEKLQYDINRIFGKISALSSRKINNTNIVQVNKYYLLIKNK